MTFGQLLKKSRKARGVTLREVAGACGLSISYLSDIEHGRKNAPDVRVVKSIERFLEVEDNHLTKGARKELLFPVEAKKIIQKKPEKIMALLRASEDMTDDELEEWIERMTKGRGDRR